MHYMIVLRGFPLSLPFRVYRDLFVYGRMRTRHGVRTRHSAYLIARGVSLLLCSVFAHILIAQGLLLRFHSLLDLCQLALQLVDLRLHCPVHLRTLTILSHS